MIRQALEWLQERIDQVDPVHTDDQGNEYWIDTHERVDSKRLKVDRFTPLGLATLDGLAEFLEERRPEEGDLTIHVLSHELVKLIGEPDDRRVREEYAVAKALRSKTFPFGTWMDQETFVITCRAMLGEDDLQGDAVPRNDRDEIISLASAVVDTEAIESLDDGVAQSITAKKGATLPSREETRGIYRVAPFRGFPEVSPVSIDVILRVRTKPVAIALFEVDPDAWKVPMVQRTKDYLAASTPVPVIG